MDRLDHVLRRMGRHATALLPFSLLLGIVFQDLAAAARPLVGPLTTLLLMLALMRTDWPRVRALLARPRCLLLDEPSIGLAPKLFQDLLQPIRALQQQNGLSILLIEQNARAALQIADQGYVMENGTIVLEGSCDALRSDPRVVETYLGIAHAPV